VAGLEDLERARRPEAGLLEGPREEARGRDHRVRAGEVGLVAREALARGEAPGALGFGAVPALAPQRVPPQASGAVAAQPGAAELAVGTEQRAHVAQEVIVVQRHDHARAARARGRDAARAPDR